MAYDESLAGRIRDSLIRTKGIVEKKMFGGVGFMLRGNMLVGVWKDSLIARIGPNAYDDAMQESHVREFDVTGRPMKGWVMVEPEGLDDNAYLQSWIERAIQYVETLPSK